MFRGGCIRNCGLPHEGLTRQRIWLPISRLVFDNSTALHTANGMLNAPPNPRDETIAHFVRVAQLTTSGFLLWLQDRDAFEVKTLKACILG